MLHLIYIKTILILRNKKITRIIVVHLKLFILIIILVNVLKIIMSLDKV